MTNLPRESVQRLLEQGHTLVRCCTQRPNVTRWDINGSPVHQRTADSFIKSKTLEITDTGAGTGKMGRFTEFKLKNI